MRGPVTRRGLIFLAGLRPSNRVPPGLQLPGGFGSDKTDFVINYAIESGRGFPQLPGEPEPPKPKSTNPGSGDGREDEWPSTVALLLRLTGIGWYVALSITLGALGGWWLDGRFDTGPAITLAGTAFGVIVAFTGMLRMLNAASRASGSSRRRRAGRSEDGPRNRDLGR